MNHQEIELWIYHVWCFSVTKYFHPHHRPCGPRWPKKRRMKKSTHKKKKKKIETGIVWKAGGRLKKKERKKQIMPRSRILFLHKDWTRVSGCDESSKEYIDLSSESQKVIKISARAGPIEIFGGLVLPLILFIFVLFQVPYQLVSIVEWRVKYRDEQGVPIVPCFFLLSDGRVKMAKIGLGVAAGGAAILGFLISLVFIFRAHVGRAYFSFVGWWARINYGFAVWCVLRGVLGLVVGATGEGIPSVVVILNPFIFSGIDFIILGSGIQRGLVYYKVFFSLNATCSVLAYIVSVAVRNECDMEARSGAITVLSVFYSIATAGQVMAHLKLDVQKLRRMKDPALRYGISSHILAPFIGPGEQAVLLFGKDNVALIQGDCTAAPRFSGDTAIKFVSPSQGLRRLMNLWAASAVVWCALSLCEVLGEASRYRAFPAARCWTTAPMPRLVTLLRIASSPFAAFLVISLSALLATHRLGALSLKWIRFWYRRNWIFVVVAFLRGLDSFRPGIPLSQGLGVFVNFSVVLCMALAMTDLLLLILPTRLFAYMYRIFVLVQMVKSAIFYVTGLAFDSPCGQTQLMGSNPRVSFLLGKIQNAVLLFFSLYFLTLLVKIKVLEGVNIPIIRLSDANRFSDGSAIPMQRFTGSETAGQEQREDAGKALHMKTNIVDVDGVKAEVGDETLAPEVGRGESDNEEDDREEEYNVDEGEGGKDKEEYGDKEESGQVSNDGVVTEEYRVEEETDGYSEDHSVGTRN